MRSRHRVCSARFRNSLSRVTIIRIVKKPPRLATADCAKAAAILLGAFCAIGCAHERVAPRPASQPTRQSPLYDRVHDVFRRATYYKPRDEDPNDRVSAMLPLMLQEIGPANEFASARNRFGAVTLDATRGIHIDATRPTVYTARAFVSLSGREYEQRFFLWFYEGTPDSDSAAPDWLGFRTTLDAEGFPIVWEVLSGTETVVQIFVSESLESASAAAMGPPLPGRRFSIERSLNDRPDVVVSRVLADGPIPMGPWVYLRAGDHVVSTIICRCMPSQVEDIAETLYYELVPLASLTEIQECTRDLSIVPASPEELDLGVKDLGDPSWLERALRLPPNF